MTDVNCVNRTVGTDSNKIMTVTYQSHQLHRRADRRTKKSCNEMIDTNWYRVRNFCNFITRSIKGLQALQYRFAFRVPKSTSKTSTNVLTTVPMERGTTTFKV